jgi:DNA-binding transcriptional LysR family regulator
MNFIWLDDFLALASTGDLSLAAKERSVSAALFTRRIRKLEEWVGADLVERSEHPPKLTPAGQRFVGAARDLVYRAARMSEEARSNLSEGDTILRIACTHALFLNFLPNWLHGLGTASLSPMLRIADVLSHCESMLEHGVAQFVVSHSHPKVRGTLHGEAFNSALVGHDELLPVSTPTGDGLPVFALVGARQPVEVLAYAVDSGFGRIQAAVLGSQMETASCSVVGTVSVASELRKMAMAGAGLAWLPRSTIEDDLRDGALVLAGTQEWTIPLEVRIYRTRQDLPGNAEAFWDALKLN